MIPLFERGVIGAYGFSVSFRNLIIGSFSTVDSRMNQSPPRIKQRDRFARNVARQRRPSQRLLSPPSLVARRYRAVTLLVRGPPKPQ